LEAIVSIEDRYKRAIEYVHRAVDTVEDKAFDASLVDWFAARKQTETARSEVARVEGRWLRATNDMDRARVARDAELLADRVQESLPGAPQDRERTNLWPGEVPTSTPATTYGDALAEQATAVARAIPSLTSGATDSLAGVGRWLLIAGGLFVAWKAIDYMHERERKRPAQPTTRELQAAVEAAANARERRL
jgi:hypothetical protein